MTEEQTPSENTSTEVVYDIKLPEGVTLDKDLIVSEAKHLGLTPEVAQKMADLRIDMMKKHIEKQGEHTKNQLKTWKEEIEKDKELGGEKLKDTISTRDRGIENVEKSVPGIKEFLESSNLIHNPKIVRLFNEIGKMSKDDKRISGSASAGPMTMTDRLISNYSKKG